MFESLETGIGLDIVLWLQENRFGLLEVLAEVLDFAGDQLFYIAAFGLIYWMFDKRLGIRMLMMLVVVSLLTFLFKDLLGRPRPYLVSDLVMPVFEDIGNGIPSGHTSITLAVWGYLAWWLKRWEVTVTVIVYVIVQAIFRMIAGVHFPQDVIGGLILGAITLALYIPLAEGFAEHWTKWSLNTKLAVTLGATILITVPVILMVENIESRENYLTMAGLIAGFGLAVIFEARQVNFIPHPDLTRRIVQYVLGLVVTIAVLFGLSILFDMLAETGTLADILRVVRYGDVGFTALGLWPYLSIRAGLMLSEKRTQTRP